MAANTESFYEVEETKELFSSVSKGDVINGSKLSRGRGKKKERIHIIRIQRFRRLASKKVDSKPGLPL